MSFASDVRRELAHAPNENREAALTELCAAVLACGGVSFRGLGRYGVQIQAESDIIMARFIALAKRFLSANGEMRQLHTDRLGGQSRYALELDDSHEVMEILMLSDKELPFGIAQSPAPALVATETQRRAFLRGAFLIIGSVNDPGNSYHLEYTSSSSALIDAILEMLQGFGLPAKLTRRKAQSVAYIKGGEQVSDALALLGANVAVMELENIRILKGVRNEANRLANCDQNNIDKIVSASQRQMSMIRVIEKRLGFDAMPDTLRELAELRLQYPDVSLTELGHMLTPPLGKSGVNARMRRIEALAEELINE